MREHFKKYWPYYLAPAIILVVAVIEYAIMGIFPFGTKSSAHYDTSAQILPIITQVVSAIWGHGKIDFSFGMAGGSDLVGDIIYTLLSPFNIIFVIFGPGAVFYVYPLVQTIKIISVTLVAIFFIRKYFKNLSNSAAFFIALLYTFGAFLMSNYTWIGWIDYLIYVPLLAMAFIHLLKTNKITYFVLMLTILIYSNYVITLESFIPLFITIGLYVMFCVPKADRPKLVTKIVLSFGISILLASPVIVTGVYRLTLSSRVAKTLNPLEQIKITYTLQEIYHKIIFFTTSLPILILCLIHTGKNMRQDNYCKFLFFGLIINLAASILFFCSSSISIAGYFGYSLRFQMYTGMLVLLTLCHLCSDKLYGKETIGAGNAIKYIAVFSIALLLVYFIISATNTGYFANNMSDVFIMFIGVVAVIPLIVVVAMGYFNRTKISRALFSFITILLVVFQCGFSYVFAVGAGSMDYATLLEENSLVTDPDEKYKILSSSYSNQTLTNAGHTITAFSSNLSRESMNFASAVCYPVNYANDISTGGGTMLSDMISGYKYIIADVDDKITTSYPYLSPIKSTEHRVLYENNLTFDDGFVLDHLITTDFDALNLEGKQNALFREFTGLNKDIILNTPATEVATIVDEKISLNISANPNSLVYLVNNTSRMISGNNLSLISGEDEYEFLTNSYQNIIPLGYYSSPTSFTLTFEKSNRDRIDDYEIWQIDYADMEYLFSTQTHDISVSAMDYTINVNIDTPDGNYLYIPYITNAGYSGARLEPNTLSLIAVKADKSAFTLTYSNPYIAKTLLIGLALLVVGIALLLLAELTNIFHVLNNSMYILYRIFLYALILVFISIPSLLEIANIFYLMIT